MFSFDMLRRTRSPATLRLPDGEEVKQTTFARHDERHLSDALLGRVCSNQRRFSSSRPKAFRRNRQLPSVVGKGAEGIVLPYSPQKHTRWCAITFCSLHASPERHAGVRGSRREWNVSTAQRHSSIRLATSAVQPVWWLAPRPAPLSPWKYS